MPFQKGVSGNAEGRKAGGKDRRRNFKTVKDKLASLGFCPIDAMVEIATNMEYAVQTRRQAVRDLLDKTWPDLQAITISADDEELKNMATLKSEMKNLLSKNKKEY